MSPSAARSVAAIVVVSLLTALVGIGSATADPRGSLVVPIENLAAAERMSRVDPSSDEVVVSTGVVGSGSVSVDPDLARYPVGSEVTLTATAAGGHSFVGWAGDVVGTQNPVTVTLSADLAVSAVFEADPPVISGVSVGGVTDSTATVSWVTDQPATSVVAYGPTTAYENGTVGDSVLSTTHSVTLSGLVSGTTYHVQPRSTDESGRTATGADSTFTTQVVVSTSAEGSGSVDVDPDRASHPVGSVVELTATAGAGHRFVGWSGDVVGTQNPLPVTLSADLSVRAAFELECGSGDGPPVISVWDGLDQRYGHAGRPQRWVNVLGTTCDPDGVPSARFRLNGGAFQPLRLGPDLRRLYGEGDFNVQIDYADLQAGPNTLVIESTDGVGEDAQTTVTIDYQPSPAPGLPYVVDFGAATSPGDVVQVVDGPWELDGGKLEPSVLAYDRTVALGDVSWQDYEVEVPITIRGFGSEYQTPQSGEKTLVGLGLRWNGHSQDDDEFSPYENWYPTGAFAWYEWFNTPGWKLIGNGDSPSDGSDAPPPAIGETYVFKARVETLTGGTRYDFKAWEQGTAEPVGWRQSIVHDSGPANGSILLIAHHMDVEFGNVSVAPLD